MNPAKLLSKLNPFSDDEAPSKEDLKKEIAEYMQKEFVYYGYPLGNG